LPFLKAKFMAVLLNFLLLCLPSESPTKLAASGGGTPPKRTEQTAGERFQVGPRNVPARFTRAVVWQEVLETIKELATTFIVQTEDVKILCRHIIL
jgi:hypothetical protein